MFVVAQMELARRNAGRVAVAPGSEAVAAALATLVARYDAFRASFLTQRGADASRWRRASPR
jgi:hypothetical protein